MPRPLTYYRSKIATMEVHPGWCDRINSVLAGLDRKWYSQFPCDSALLMALHYRECNNNRNCQMFNGERWNRRTTLVPKGLGPWNSAEDAMHAAIEYKQIPSEFDEMAEALQFIEGWNGWGYMNKGVPSPYVWSGSNHYISGKYVADGQYDPAVVDRQLGAGVLYLALKDIRMVQTIVDDVPTLHTTTHPKASGATIEDMKELQRALAKTGFYGGVIDGLCGAKTRAAAKEAFRL